MITNVATCIAPVMPAAYTKRRISDAITCGFGCGLRSSKSTARFAGERIASATTAITPTTHIETTTHACRGSEVLRWPDCRASWKPAPSVIVTTVGMITSIFGMKRFVNSTRARDGHRAEDRADHEADEEVDRRPERTADHVVEGQRPGPVAGDRDHEPREHDRDERERAQRQDRPELAGFGRGRGGGCGLRNGRHRETIEHRSDSANPMVYARMVAADNGLGIFFTGTPAPLTIDLARRADAAGFRSAWFPEITFADSFGPATAAAQQTERISLGTGVVGIWSRSLVTLALQAATLHQLSDERLLLGIGVQARGYVRGWHGQEYRKPVTAMREALEILRALLARERVTYDGEIFSVKGFGLDMELPAQPAKIYVAANGPKMIQLAGELADGMLGYFHSVEYVRDVVMPNLQIGAARAGRSVDELDIAVGFPSVVTPDDSGIGLAKGQVMMFATALDSAPAYLDSVKAAGFGDAAQEIGERVRAGDVQGALSLVSDEMADALTLSGSPENVRRRIAAYRDAGLTCVMLNPSPPGGWFPLYEGHFGDDVLAQIPPFDFPGFMQVLTDTVESLAA